MRSPIDSVLVDFALNENLQNLLTKLNLVLTASTDDETRVLEYTPNKKTIEIKKEPVCPIDIRVGDPCKAGRGSCHLSVSRRDKGQKNIGNIYCKFPSFIRPSLQMMRN